MEPPRPLRSGEGVSTTAGIWKRLWDYVQSLQVLTSPGSGLASQSTPSGIRLWLEQDPPIWIKLTAVSGGAYAWTAQRALTGGGWADIPGLAGTTTEDPAYEENGTAVTITGGSEPVVLAYREPHSRRLLFARGICA